MAKIKPISTEEILQMLCESVTDVLSTATGGGFSYSPMVQKITKTCLKPDIGCFVLIDGGFSGLVVINFPGDAALEIYKTYMSIMGMPSEDLATQHTNDEVGNILGELMNQMVGDFTGKIAKELLTHITQNQPKMLVINKEVELSINTNLNRPQARRVTFSTANNNIFYLEFAMDKTEFIKLHDFEKQNDLDPDAILEEAFGEKAAVPASGQADVDANLLDELGL